MNKRVRNLCVILFILSMLFALAGCGSAGSSNNGEDKDQNTSVGASQNVDALAGKTLIPFSTHEGSGLSGFDTKLSSACPDSTVLDGLAIRGNDAQNAQDDVRAEVEEWISGLGL